MIKNKSSRTAPRENEVHALCSSGSVLADVATYALDEVRQWQEQVSALAESGRRLLAENAKLTDRIAESNALLAEMVEAWTEGRVNAPWLDAGQDYWWELIDRSRTFLSGDQDA